MDYTQIQADFNKVISYSQGIAEPKTDKLFAAWYEAKKKYIDLFNGQLIYEVPDKVTFNLTEKAKVNKVNYFIEKISSIYNNQQLADFIQKNIKTFFDNELFQDYEFQDKKIPAHSKLIKAFKFFEQDKQALSAIQNEASILLQENKIEGTLCFSVHPLDFLSSSENTYNWRTCHSLTGEYRAGNLSYMQDKSTIVCYLKGDKDAILPMFPQDLPWNNKKWRMLLHFSETGDLVFAGRQYPFFSSSGLSQAFNKCPIISPFHSLPSENYISEINGLILNHKYIEIRRNLYKLNQVVPHNSHSLHFNDILNSSIYTKPYYIYDWDKKPTNPPRVDIGGEVYCLECGKNHILNPESMRCIECELEYGTEDNDTYTFCEHCGTRIVKLDGIDLGSGELVCQNCAENECFVCDCCDELYFKSEQHYYDGCYYCDDCYMEVTDGSEDE